MFDSTSSIQIKGACPYCSSALSKTFHSGKCPKVKAIERYPNGAVKRVEFHENR